MKTRNQTITQEGASMVGPPESKVNPGGFLVETWLATSRVVKREGFYQSFEQFRAASDSEQVKPLGNELGRFVFGEEFEVNHASARNMGPASPRRTRPSGGAYA
jgi:hypothetical protein